VNPGKICPKSGLGPHRPRFARPDSQATHRRRSPRNGTDHGSHAEQASMIRRYIIWRNNHAYDERLRRIVAKANVA
jgi:hypothetical protein